MIHPGQISRIRISIRISILDVKQENKLIPILDSFRHDKSLLYLTLWVILLVSSSGEESLDLMVVTNSKQTLLMKIEKCWK
jgi:hypothetical protein